MFFPGSRDLLLLLLLSHRRYQAPLFSPLTSSTRRSRSESARYAPLLLRAILLLLLPATIDTRRPPIQSPYSPNPLGIYTINRLKRYYGAFYSDALRKTYADIGVNGQATLYARAYTSALEIVG